MMNFMHFEIPVLRKKDVLVIGGGCAGISAAVSAARHGSDVLLVEKNGFLGGMATAGLIGPFMTCFDPEGKRQVIKGVFEEFVQRMIALGGAIHPAKIEAGSSYAGYRVYGHAHCGPFNPECFKIVAEQMCVENNVELLYNATFVATVLNETKDSIKGVVLATKAGLIQVDADIVIDCSGDADVAYQSGVPFRYGDDEGKTQPGSMFFTIKGIDKSKLEQVRTESGDFTSIFFQKLINEEINSGRYSVPRNKFAVYENPDGTFRVNMSRIYLKDGCDPFEITKASIESRGQITEIISLMRRLIPGCENVELVDSAAALGLRETRRIQGDFVLKGEDILNKRKFDDVVFLAGNSIDMHNGNAVSYITAEGEPYQIPYRILLPKKISNLLVAGRCCSLDRVALAAIRVMPPVFAMGQAAGTAAALCVQDGHRVAEVDIKKLQNCLIQDGAVLE